MDRVAVVTQGVEDRDEENTCSLSDGGVWITCTSCDWPVDF